MKILGRHLIAELAECNPTVLNNLPRLKSALIESARKSGATIVDSVFHQYNPQGISGIIVIAESHISLHAWPEYNYAAVDCFTCGTSVDPQKALDFLQEALGCKSIYVREIHRGIPSESHELLAHKPVEARLSSRVNI